MRDLIEQIIFFDELSSEDSTHLRKHVASNPEASALARQWMSFRHAVSDRLHADLGDRTVFTLYALARAGRTAELTDAEQQAVEVDKAKLDHAVDAHPGLLALADDIASAADAFDAAWASMEEGGAFDALPAAISEEPTTTVRTVRSRTTPPSLRDRRPRRRSSAGRWAVRSGIAVAVITFAAVLFLLVRRDYSTVTVETAANETRTVMLKDGSTVRLMGGSRLSYVPPEKASIVDREARLEGRGFFEITPADQGFVVTTATAQATVLGTSFGVEAAEGMTRVVLATGRLSLAPKGDSKNVVVLEPGQMSRVAAGSAPTPPVDVHVAEELAWTGLFVFSSTPLAQILEDLSAYYNVALEAGESLREERVTGTFERGQSIREILEVIASALGATVEKTGVNGYTLVPS